MFKKQNGITLVALVITIIVLLILAGVTISMVVGQNGVLTQAKSAQTKTKEEEAKEMLSLTISGIQGDYVGATNETRDFYEYLGNATTSNDTTTYSVQDCQSKFTANATPGVTITITAVDGTSITGTVNGYSFTLVKAGAMGVKISTFNGSAYQQ